jgi:outer membrane protein assembly complex protein YaeT
MRRAAGRAAAGALLVLLPAVAAADVGDYVGKPVQAIRLAVEGRSDDDPRLLALIETAIGRPLSMLDVRESAAHLYSLGRFDDVVVRAEAVGDGVALVFDLVPVHPVASVRLNGAPGIPGVNLGDLRRTLSERFGVSPVAARAPDMVRLLQDQLGQRGYLAASVTSRVDLEHAPHRAALTLTIEAGERTRVGAVEITGAAGMDERELFDRLGITPGSPYEPAALSERIDGYLAAQRQRGYLEARLTSAVRLSEDNRTAGLTLASSLGPRVRVEFQGDPLPASRRDDLVPIAREGSADEDLLEDASNAIEEYLRGQGYRDASAPHSREEVGGELLITFTIRRGPQYRVAEVDITGNTSIPRETFQDRLRLRAGQPFASALLEADLALIEDLYHRSGFASVRADPVIEPMPGPPGDSQVPVVIRIPIIEQAQTIVASVGIEGNQSVPGASLRDQLGLRPGQPFYLSQLAVDRDALQLHYANLGYPTATIVGNPGLSADGTRADVLFTVREGPRIFIDHVLIAGNTRTRTETIERELQLKAGDPLGLAAVAESQRRLAALGLFRRTRITELGHGDETTRDVLVAVEEAPATTVGYGGGLEVGQRIRTEANGIADERLEVAPRAFFEIGRRNLFGKNRSVNLFTRVSLRPEDAPVVAGEPVTQSGYGFSEYRVLGTFREPRALGTDADAFLTGTIEQQVRSSFNFARRAFSAEVARRLTPRVSAGGNYQIQRTELFDEKITESDKLLVDRLFPQLRLSSFSSSVVRDTRDDALNPGSGNYLSANAQLAARLIGSEVGLAKSYLTAQIFRSVPRTNQIVFAASARVGTAVGFARDVMAVETSGQPILDSDGRPIVQTLSDLPASERFFAGGDTTVRGFALDQLGAPDTIDENGFPIGGNAVVIFNGELRVPLFGGVGVVGFFDTGNVFKRTSDIDLGQLRSAVGFGVRYRSPVGPIRIDLGIKVNRKELVAGSFEQRSALHISLGQAF